MWMIHNISEISKPTAREIPVQGLNGELQSPRPANRKGRILLVEDASKLTIEEIGSFFDVDPWFFASYVHQAWRKTSTQSPTTCSLPSRDKKQAFLPLQYHRTVACQQKDIKLTSLTRDCNHQRKAVILPTMGGVRIGLIQHCCSVLLVDRPEREWTGIVLVDPPISNNYLPSRRHGPLPPTLNSVPFLGGCEDFSNPPAAESNKEKPDAISNRGMLDELVHYWCQQYPPMFAASRPTLRSLSYYPLKIVAAEWVNYISVMGMSLREYELSTAASSNPVAELDGLNSDLRILQGWRRRVLATQAKMQRTIRFIKNHSNLMTPSDDWDALLEDYQFIRTEVADHGNRIEAMVPLVTSATALIESRRSLAETANVTRLTVLAVVFLPLSYVAALFSMSESFRPGGSLFWMYFAIAIPLALIVALIAKPPVSTVKKAVGKIRSNDVAS